MDGETDWKLRYRLFDVNENENFLKNHQISVEEENDNLYTFKGFLNGKEISLKNTLWQNTVCKSSDIVGLVIYSGRNTKSR